MAPKAGKAVAQGNRLREDKGRSVREQNIIAARAVADAVRTSLGPRGMDKMIQSGRGDVVISNDGATILSKMDLGHPCAKMLCELSKSQDVEAGDGTTSVVVIAGSLLSAAQNLLQTGLHPQVITEAFLKAAGKSDEIMRAMAIPVDLADSSNLIKAAKTSLCSKVVAQNSDLFADIAVNAVLKAVGPENIQTATNVDLNDIRVSKKLGGTIDDSELVEGLVMTQKVSRGAGGPGRIQNAKIGLIQFCLSPPKTDMESNVVIKDYTQMDRLLREERLILAKMVKAIAKTGCNVLLIQKSILRDATTELSLDFCAKAKIMVIRDVERDEVEYLSRILGVEAAASLDQFTEDKLAQCDVVSEEQLGGDIGSIVRFTGLKTVSSCVSVLVRGTNILTLDETERSLHDALCVVRSLVKTRALLPGGGAVEMELAVELGKWARSLPGEEAYCVRAFAEALEVIPYTLAENAGLAPVEVVTKLRAEHAAGVKFAGINVKRGQISNLVDEDKDSVLQPLLVSSSIINMATETVRMILKIDDMVMTK
jgi:T-complex protein 1 subunit delta